jgi:signal transduction histidine kinase
MQRAAALEERAQLLDVERDQEMRLAATTERARIARELHDVVAHSLSVVIAQADGGRYAGKADPEAATGALEAIAATGRQALTDMRALLGVLRDGGGEEYAPQPDVEAIPALVEDVRASGLDVDLITEGTPRSLPAGPQLAAYRIVQESLTNVLKHAGPAGRAWVRLQWRDDALELSVLDDGRGASAAMVDADGDGQGIRGMVERAQLHGGRLEAGPRHSGGFGVHAALPYGHKR